MYLFVRRVRIITLNRTHFTEVLTIVTFIFVIVPMYKTETFGTIIKLFFGISITISCCTFLVFFTCVIIRVVSNTRYALGFGYALLASWKGCGLKTSKIKCNFEIFEKYFTLHYGPSMMSQRKTP